jgi:hypothetical protein
MKTHLQYYYPIKISLILSFLISSGCLFLGDSSNNRVRDDSSTGTRPSKYTKTFDVDFETVWSAVLASLDGMPLDKIDKEKGIIKTGWVEGLSQRKARSILTDRFLEDYWKERFRLIVKISGNILNSSITVRAQVQEKARGGSAAYRWERKKSSGEREEGILTRIEEILTEG